MRFINARSRGEETLNFTDYYSRSRRQVSVPYLLTQQESNDTRRYRYAYKMIVVNTVRDICPKNESSDCHSFTVRRQSRTPGTLFSVHSSLTSATCPDKKKRERLADAGRCFFLNARGNRRRLSMDGVIKRPPSARQRTLMNMDRESNRGSSDRYRTGRNKSRNYDVSPGAVYPAGA